MNSFSNSCKPLSQKLNKWEGYYKPVFSILMGAAFLAAISLITIQLPHTPVPITLQVFGVFLLILLQSSKQALGSVFLYLGLATLGLPVLAGGKANSAWLFQAGGGYLLGFACAAYVAGWLLKQKSQPAWWWTILSLTAGLICILALGAIWLGYFIGFDQAFAKGVQPFWLGGFLKMLAALFCARCLKKIRE